MNNKIYEYLGAVFSRNGKVEVKLEERFSKVGRKFNALKTTLMRKKDVPQVIKPEVIKGG